MEEKIDPQVHIALIERQVFLGCAGLLGLAWRIIRCGSDSADMRQSDALRHNQFLLARKRKAEVLASRQLKVLRGIVVLVLQLLVLVFKLSQIVLLLQSSYLLFKFVIDLDGFDATPTDEQYHNRESNQAERANVSQLVDPRVKS